MATFASPDDALWVDVTTCMTLKGLTSLSAFRSMDRDRGGTVTARELHNWARTVGIKLKPAEAKRMATRMGGGADGFTYKAFSQLTREYKRRAARAKVGKMQSTAAARASVEGAFGGAARPPVEMAHAGKSIFLKTLTSRYERPSRAELAALWASQDANANGLLSLAEIDRVVASRFPDWNNKPALLRAYKFANNQHLHC